MERERPRETQRENEADIKRDRGKETERERA